MKRKLFIISALIIFILFSGFVSAQDISDEIINTSETADEFIGIDETSNPQLTQSEENSYIENASNSLTQSEDTLYQSENDGQFNDLNSKILNNDEITLDKNYTYTTKYDSSLKNGIDIDKNVTINGNNFTIDGNGMSTIFNIKNNARLTLNNVCIINTFTGDTNMITNHGELIFNNVNFTSHRSISTAGSGVFKDIYNTGSLTITCSNFINSEFEITATTTTNLNNINVRGLIDNEGTLSISNTLFNNNQFTPTNKFGRSHDISILLFNNASDLNVVLTNITVTNNTVRYTSSAQETFRGLIRNENGNLIITNSLFENNTALFPNSNSDCFGILTTNGNQTTISNCLFKTNEFKDTLIASYANNLTIMKSVFDTNTVSRNIIQNKASGQINVTHNIFLNNKASKLIDTTSTFLVKIDENYWGTNEPEFSYIASTNYNPKYIILSVDGPSEVHEKEAVYTLTLNQLNTNETIAGDKLYDYHIDVESNNLGTMTQVELKNGTGHYIYIPIDKGEDMLRMGSIKFKVNVTAIFLSANIEIITEYEKTVFAGTNNSVIAKVFVNRDFGIYVVKLFCDGVEIGETVEDLSRTPKEIIFLDEEIRPIDATTALGANNKQINYTVQVYKDDELIGNTTLIAPLLYNGYFGKEYGYHINDVEFDYTAQITGDVMIQLQDGSTYMDSSETRSEFEWRTVLSDDSEFTVGLLYIPYNWDKTTTGPYPEFNLIFNNQNINAKLVGKYKDQSNMGKYGTLGYGVLIYNVTNCLKNGRNTLILEKEMGLTAVYPPTLITMFNTSESETLKTVYIKNGADLLYNAYNLANRPIEANAEFMLTNIENMTKATLHVFAAGAGVDEADMKFNKKVYINIWENSTGTNYNGEFIADVTNLVEKSNKVTFISTGGTILSLQNILVVTQPIIKEKPQINLETEYKNTAYAGTNNTITVNVKMDKDGTYDIKLFANGNEVANTTRNLTTDWMAFLLTDNTIRPIDETTVSGAQNQKINYTLKIYQNDNLIANSTIIIPLLYNGYLGKDYAYPNSNLEFDYQNTITGGILVQIQEDGTYLELKQKDRTDYWEITLPEKSKIINSFLYIAYNWDKTSSSDYPKLTLTFNGRNIENKLVGRYKDQSNLGSSGKYGYGLLIYDVSDLIYKGQNSLVLKKESGLTAIYPSTLITIYNTTGSNYLKNVIIDNDADLLYNSYNLANRSVQYNNIMELTPLEKTTLYVFAASANNGDADLKINNNSYSNIWSEYESTYHNGVFKTDVTGIIQTNNTVNVIATGGTILALQQIIVTEKMNKVTPEPANKPKTKTATKIIAKNKAYKVKTKIKKLTAILKTSKNKIIKSKIVSFRVNGKTYTTRTNSKGVATFKAKINKKGTFNVLIKFAGDSNYKAKSIKIKLIIK